MRTKVRTRVGPRRPFRQNGTPKGLRENESKGYALLAIGQRGRNILHCGAGISDRRRNGASDYNFNPVARPDLLMHTDDQRGEVAEPGLRRTPGERVLSEGSRGFKSPPLRQPVCEFTISL
jgi:hypothetical protein